MIKHDGDQWGFYCPYCSGFNQLPEDIVGPLLETPKTFTIQCEDCHKLTKLTNIHREIVWYDIEKEK